MILLTKLLLAHMVGDFILQPASWVKAKQEKKLKPYLLLHALVHGVLIMLLVWDWSFLKWAFMLAFAHLIIDVIVLSLQKEQTQRTYFFVDQAFHVLSICVIYYLYTSGVIDLNLVWKDQYWVLITLVVLNTLPGAIVIKTILAKWESQIESLEKESLQEAGKYIGMLERFFVLTFVITGNWEAIGFLVAAKSVFRFGDLTNAKDRKLTEYILTGTLISFGIAMLSGILYLKYIGA